MPNKHGHSWIRARRRLAIYLRDGLQCQWCQRTLESGLITLSLDHARPREHGGSNAATNLFAACIGCNSARQTRSMRGFAAYNLGLDPLSDDPRIDDLLNAIRWTRRRSIKGFLAQAARLLEGRNLTQAIREAHTGT